MKSSILQYLNSWKAHKTLQLSSLIVLIANFIFISGVISLTENFNKVLTLWGDKVTLGVYLKDHLEPQKIESLSQSIQQIKEVGNLHFISAEEAFHDFQDQMKTYAPQILKESDVANFLPSSFEVSLASNIKLENHLQVLQQISSKIQSLDGVDEVTYGQTWVNKFNKFIITFQKIAQALLLILFSAVFYIISSSLKSSIYQRSDEIELMELLGASSMMIRKPFILEGIFHGLIASLFAVVIYFGIFTYFTTYLQSHLAFMQLAGNLTFLSDRSIMLILISGPLAGGLAAYLSLRKLNSGWLASEGS
jgi:cell division transport system permease protein